MSVRTWLVGLLALVLVGSAATYLKLSAPLSPEHIGQAADQTTLHAIRAATPRGVCTLGSTACSANVTCVIDPVTKLCAAGGDPCTNGVITGPRNFYCATGSEIFCREQQTGGCVSTDRKCTSTAAGCSCDQYPNYSYQYNTRYVC